MPHNIGPVPEETPKWHGLNLNDYVAADDAALDEALAKATDIDPVHLKNFTEAGLINVPVSGEAYRNPVGVRLANVDIVRMQGGTVQMKLYDRDDNAVALIEDDAVKLQEFALRILQQTTYTFADQTKR